MNSQELRALLEPGTGADGLMPMFHADLLYPDLYLGESAAMSPTGPLDGSASPASSPNIHGRSTNGQLNGTPGGVGGPSPLLGALSRARELRAAVATDKAFKRSSTSQQQQQQQQQQLTNANAAGAKIGAARVSSSRNKSAKNTTGSGDNGNDEDLIPAALLAHMPHHGQPGAQDVHELAQEWLRMRKQMNQNSTPVASPSLMSMNNSGTNDSSSSSSSTTSSSSSSAAFAPTDNSYLRSPMPSGSAARATRSVPDIASLVGAAPMLNVDATNAAMASSTNADAFVSAPSSLARGVPFSTPSSNFSTSLSSSASPASTTGLSAATQRSRTKAETTTTTSSRRRATTTTTTASGRGRRRTAKIEKADASSTRGRRKTNGRLKADNADEKTLRRRARERASARRCRERKNQMLETLQQQVNDLRAENEMLRKQQNMGRLDILFQERERLMMRMHERLKAHNTSEQEIRQWMIDVNINSLRMRDLLRRDLEMLPVILDMSRWRNMVLWMLLTPIDAKYYKSLDQSDDDDDDSNAASASGDDTAKSSRKRKATPSSEASDGDAQHAEKRRRRAPNAAAPTAAERAAADPLGLTPRDATAQEFDAHMEMVTRLRIGLQREVRLSKSQIDRVVMFRNQWLSSIKRSFEANRQVLELLADLEQKRKQVVTFHSLINTIRLNFVRILTPEQHAKMVLWLHSHQNMLQYKSSSTQAAAQNSSNNSNNNSSTTTNSNSNSATTASPSSVASPSSNTASSSASTTTKRKRSRTTRKRSN
eukprot:TRINITY_DN504_c0_g1_i1.p1 TRINITY_DN504_c0_g1~~TRINITY_DN504_c0_g1_i1.p1  ORF type:complete len:768 (+),score=363.12 TRINITY_DN504_c0_g1_i1:258-2561(+)